MQMVGKLACMQDERTRSSAIADEIIAGTKTTAKTTAKREELSAIFEKMRRVGSEKQRVLCL